MNPAWYLKGMSKPKPPTYKTRNWPAYNESLKRRGSVTVWFDPEMIWEAKPTGKRGRQPGYSDAAVQTCLTMKGEGRLGNDPMDRFSPERAKPRACLAWRSARRPGLLRACWA